MSNDTIDYKSLTGAERGVEAIKELHRIVRRNIVAAEDGNAEAMSVLETALDLLAILRPEMTREAILVAAERRLEA